MAFILKQPYQQLASHWKLLSTCPHFHYFPLANLIQKPLNVLQTERKRFEQEIAEAALLQDSNNKSTKDGEIGIDDSSSGWAELAHRLEK